MKTINSNSLVKFSLLFLACFALIAGCTEKNYITIVQPDEPEPRVIWVPDDFETIQGAINASVDGDTVRVGPGIYREGLRVISKSIWLESELGSEQTVIDATNPDTIGYASGIWFRGESTNSVLRGFTIRSDFNGIISSSLCRLTILNCLVIDADKSINGIVFDYSNITQVYNCIVDGADWGVFVRYDSGLICNSMFINCNVGYLKSATAKYWIDYGWNLFWNNGENYRYEYPKDSDVFADPQFIPGSYVPSRNSPAIDRGNPNFIDKDGSRSDIGIHGGLYAY